MNKRIVYLTLFLVLWALVFDIWHGATQTADERRISTQVREQAARMLQSPMTKYLSSSGRNALNLIANPPVMAPRAELTLRSQQTREPLLPLLAPHEVMVNDPAQDISTDAIDASTQNSTSVASFNGTVLVAYNDTGQYREMFSATGYSRSTDGGRTFVDMGILPPPTLGINFGNPGLVADRDGNFYASSIIFDSARPIGFGYGIGISKSVDGGATFQPPVSVPPLTGDTPSNIMDDRPFITADNSDNPATKGNLYVTYTHLIDGLSSPIAFSRSIDGGASFSAPILLTSPNDSTFGSEAVVGKNGEVYVTWLRPTPLVDRSEPSAIFVAKSTDGGQSFGAPVPVARFTEIGFHIGYPIPPTLAGGFAVNSCPRIDVSPADGTVYVVYAANPPGPDGADIFLTRSIDGGATWSVPEKVNSDNSAQEFFPDIAVNRNGTVQVIWYGERLVTVRGDRPQISLSRARSFDRGRSFSREERVGRESFTPAFGYDVIFLPTSIGDYIDIKAGLTSNGFGQTFHLAWVDCRRAVTTEGGSRFDQDIIYSLDR